MVFFGIIHTISYLFGTFFAKQGTRSVLDRPIIYSETSLFLLTIIFGWLMSIYVCYLVFLIYGLLGIFVFLLIRFILLPTIFNNLIFKYMKDLGI